MTRLLPVILTCIALIASAPFTYGHKQTEQFIPIGQSPGLSDKYTFIGTIEKVDIRNKLLKIKGEVETRQVRITAKTKVWLDRSKLKMTNLRGDPGQIRKGQRIEVKYTDIKRKRDAEWIKVEIATPAARP